MKCLQCLLAVLSFSLSYPFLFFCFPCLQTNSTSSYFSRHALLPFHSRPSPDFCFSDLQPLSYLSSVLSFLYHTSRRSIHKCHIERRSTLLYRHLWWSSLTSKRNASRLRLHSRLSSAWLQLPTQPYCALFP